MVINGTSYHDDTVIGVIQQLERARANGTRIRVHFGDTDSGRDWLEEFDVTGTVGRSMGPVKVPLLIHNCRSMGGGAILDHCIVRIRYSANMGLLPDLYRHPDYHVGDVVLRARVVGEYQYEVLVNDKVHARFESKHKATRWLTKMGIELGEVVNA